MGVVVVHHDVSVEVGVVNEEGHLDNDDEAHRREVGVGQVKHVHPLKNHFDLQGPLPHPVSRYMNLPST